MTSRFFDRLENWRQRPEPVRRRLAAALSLAAALLVLTLWLINFSYRHPLRGVEEKSPETAAAGIGFLPSAWDRIKAGWQILLEQSKIIYERE